MLKMVIATISALILVGPSEVIAQDSKDAPWTRSPEHKTLLDTLCRGNKDGHRTKLSERLAFKCDSNGNTPEPQASVYWYNCTGGSGGNIHGRCADSWFDHVWEDVPYCRDVQRWCEWGGGTFDKKKL